MLLPVKMSFVRILVMKRQLSAVANLLSGQRSLHIVEVGAPRPVLEDKTMLERLSSLERGMKSALEGLSLAIPSGFQEVFDPEGTIAEASSLLEQEIEPTLGRIRERMRELWEKKERTMRLIAELEGLRPLEVDLRKLRELRFISISLGYVPRRNLSRLLESIRGIRAVIVPHSFARDEVFVAAMVLKRAEARLRAALKGAYFKPLELVGEVAGSPEEAIRRLREDLGVIDAELRTQERALEELAARWGGDLGRLLGRVRFNRALLEFLEHFGGTETTAVISGFVPTCRVEAIRAAVGSITSGRFAFESEEISSKSLQQVEIPARPPTLLRNPSFLRLFESLAKSYGYPRYGELDPTVLLALTFAVMFGFMFGDLGQGPVIAAMGALLMIRPPEALRKVSYAGGGLVLCGLSAAIFGALYGSVFGREGLIPALWGRPLEDIGSFLVAGLLYGVFQNLLGLGANLVNSLRLGEYREMLFGEFGLASLGFYLSLLGAGYSALVVGCPAWARISLLAMAAFLLLLLRGHGEERPRGLLVSILGLFDMVLRYLTNTVSFMRLSAFAMAHVALGMAVYLIAGAVAAIPGGAAFGVLVVILGNLGVIALEGVIVGIQCLRLEFYEFFSKFVRGDGVAYAPWSLEEGLEKRS